LKEWQGEDGHFLYQDAEDQSHRDAVKESVSYAKNIVQSVVDGSITPSDLSKLALHVATVARFGAYTESVQQERDSLKQKLEEIKKSTPGTGPISSPSKSSGTKQSASAQDSEYQDQFVSYLEQAQRS